MAVNNNKTKIVYNQLLFSQFDISEITNYNHINFIFIIFRDFPYQIDMVTEDETRWSQADYPFLPKRKYIVDGLEKFDATMFKINPKQADLMDPQCRILIELAYSTILDAGIHPSTLRGSRTGVFTANTSDSAVSDDPNPMDSSQSTG